MTNRPTNQMNILVVEDDEVDSRVVERHLLRLQKDKPSIRFARTWTNAEELINGEMPDLILLDMGLPDSDGLETVEAVMRLSPACPVIVLTGDDDDDRSLAALAAGVSDYLVKSTMTLDYLRRAIRYSMERKRADQRVRKQAELLNRTDEGIVVFDLHGRISFRNQGAYALFDHAFEGIARDNFFHALGMESEAINQAVVDLRRHGHWHGEITTSGGRVIFTRWTASETTCEDDELEIVSVNSDITERKSVEHQLRRSQRLEGVGALACGIAHDFNNLLGPMLMSVELAADARESEEDFAADISTMKSCIERGRGLVEQLLTFGRGVDGQRQRLEADVVMKEVAQLAKSTFPRQVELDLQIPTDLWPVTGDGNQIYQVLLNLVVNGRDAMPGGGQLKIAAHNRPVSMLEADNRSWEPGDYVCLEVSDQGAGIPKELHDRIFEPFYTTKDRQQGTGLGLSTTLGIVKSHNGYIRLDSEPDQGSVFQVLIPRNLDCEQPEEITTSEFKTSGAELNGKSVLVVDDNPAILKSISTLLQRLNANVMTAANGREALELYAKGLGEYDLIVADLDMPKMHGSELIRLLRDSGSDLPIIIVTGTNVSDDMQREYFDLGVAEILRKPFSCDTLAKSMHVSLSAGAVPVPAVSVAA